MNKNRKIKIIFNCVIFIGMSVCCTGISGESIIPQTYDWSQSHEVFVLSGHTDDVTRAVYNPDGSRIITLSRDSTARIWDAESGKSMATLNGHSGAVRGVVFISGGAQIKTFADDNVIKVWDAENGKEIKSVSILNINERINSVDFSPDGSLIALGMAGHSEIYDSETGKHIHTLSPLGHPGLRVGTIDIGFRPDGERIVIAAYSQEISVWNTKTGVRILNLHEHGQGAITAVYNPDMTLIASGSRDKTVIIWDARLGTVIKKLEIGWEVLSASFSPDGETLLVVERAPRGEVKRASFWDMRNLEKIADLSDFGPTRNSSFHPKGNRLVTPSGKNVRVFEANPRKKVVPGVTQDDGSEILFDNILSKGLSELVEAALKSGIGKIRVQALNAIAQIDTIPEEIFQKLIDALKSEKNQVRINAALVLAEINTTSSRATAALIDRLKNDEDARVRTASALAIGCISEAIKMPIAVDELIERLKDEDKNVRYHSAHALDKMASGAEESLPALIQTVLYDPEFGIRRQIAFNIGNWGKKSLGAIPTLIKGTSAEDERARWWACYTLWCIAAGTGEAVKSAIPALKKSIQDPSDFRDENGGPPRKYAIHAIGAVGPVVKEQDPEIIKMLENIMENDDEYYHRKAAALALESILEVKGLRQKVRGYRRRTSR